jgi:hypothetical protein
MVDEGTLGLARALHQKDAEQPDKEELQRRMEEARDSISQTVMEIKETVTNQYYSVKESVSDALDWRHHFRQRPVAFSLGALSVGLLCGYTLAGAIKRSDRDEGASSHQYDDPNRHTAFHGHSYAAQPITDSLPGDDDIPEPRGERDSAAEPASQGGSFSYSTPRRETEATEEEQKPGLYQRFKGTTAYDRLQTEVSTLGDRFMDELATTAHTIVLPMVFKKLKQLIGVDLSDKQTRTQAEPPPATASRSADNAGQATGASASAASASAQTSNKTYATSENRSYGAGSSAGDSVLDLDR